MSAGGDRLNLPNLLTVLRIAACPAVYFLAMSTGVVSRFVAFALFVFAAVTDLWDGYLARKHGQITDVGKLLDPLADKLLVVATFVPIYVISHRVGPEWPLPWWGALPLWVLIVIFGRELAITVFRSYAVRKGVVISAGRSGKYKAFIQNLFVGGALLWYPLLAVATEQAWNGGAWSIWSWFHGAWIGIMLAVALFLTVYSMVDYLWGHRSVFSLPRAPEDT